MRSTRASSHFVAALIFGGSMIGGALDAGATDPTADVSGIGRYRVERIGTTIAISQPRDRGIALTLLAGGLVVAGLGQAVRAGGRIGAGSAVLLLGLGIAAVGGVAMLAAERWRANETELVRERFGGRVERWPRTAIAEVVITRRVASAEDFKRARIRPWDVTVRGPDGRRLPVRFSVESEAAARSLAATLGAALRVEVRAPG
jgi:hypothetical protein